MSGPTEGNLNSSLPAAPSGKQNSIFQAGSPYTDPSTGLDERDISCYPPSAASGAEGALALSGDLGGSSGTPKVVGLQGIGISATSPTNGQVLQYDSSSGLYVPATVGGGGGGGSVYFTSYLDQTPAYSSSAYATKGMEATCLQAVTIARIFANISGNSGDVYQAAILALTNSTTISSVLATSNTFTFASTTAGVIIFSFASPPTLTPGTLYLFSIQITSGSGSTPCEVADQFTQNTNLYMLIPGCAPSDTYGRIASVAPSSGTLSTGTTGYAIEVVGTI